MPIFFPNSYKCWQLFTLAPPKIAPISKLAANSTEVLSVIICIYSSMLTFSNFEKSMSNCWPSQTSLAVLLNSCKILGKY